MFVMPKVGDKVTVRDGLTKEAHQVVRVAASGKTMWIKRNHVELDVCSQEWNIFENKFEGEEIKATLRSNGQWHVTETNCGITIGEWKEHQAYSF